MPLQSVYYELSDPGLKPLSGLTEIYIPLWVHSVGSATATTSFNYFLQKGTTSTSSSTTGTAVKLHTLSAGWGATQKFALEVSMYTSAGTARAWLMRFDSNGGAGSAAGVTTTSTTATILRSSPVVLTPGATYGVVILSETGSTTTYLTKAHLIALM